jgi:RNA polymerase sigma factor (sigma-70 family)
LLTWLCTFCRHEIAAHHARADRFPIVELPEDGPEIAAALDSVDRMEVARLVHVALDRLPPRYAEALEWKYVDGLSVSEIAVRAGTSTKAAESLLTRAREAFRDLFAALRPDRGTRG